MTASRHKLCPLTRGKCAESDCGWWTTYSAQDVPDQCAVPDIADSLCTAAGALMEIRNMLIAAVPDDDNDPVAKTTQPVHH